MDSINTWELEIDPVYAFVDGTAKVLRQIANHTEHDRKKVVYYAAATHYLDKFDPFPALDFHGPQGTGKSSTLGLLNVVCFRPVMITGGKSLTEAALKAKMNEADGGTLIIEEAELLGDAEELTISRFSTQSARYTKMVKSGGDWVPRDFKSYGATIVHRRHAFRDPAMLRRTIPVRTHRAAAKKFTSWKLFVPYLEALRKLMVFPPQLPAASEPKGIEASVLDCYRPLLAVAEYLQDEDFIDSLTAEMGHASKDIREEESGLETGQILRAIIALVADKTQGKLTADLVNVPVADLKTALASEYGYDGGAMRLTSNQRNRIIREDLKFDMRSSHGLYRVYVTIGQLIKMADEWSVQDDLIEEWRKEIAG